MWILFFCFIVSLCDCILILIFMLHYIDTSYYNWRCYPVCRYPPETVLRFSAAQRADCEIRVRATGFTSGFILFTCVTWGVTASTLKQIRTKFVYIAIIALFNSPFCVTVSLWTAFFCRAMGRIKSEFVLALTEMLFYPFLIVSHVGVKIRVDRQGFSATTWHNPCEEPFTLQRSTAVALM